MPTLTTVIDAFVAAREYDQATVSRLVFWNNQLGDFDIDQITPDEVDQAIVQLVLSS